MSDLEERREELLRLVNDHPMYPTSSLSKMLERKHEQVYRDLLALEKAGRVKRIKTGAWRGHRWFVEGTVPGFSLPKSDL